MNIKDVKIDANLWEVQLLEFVPLIQKSKIKQHIILHHIFILQTKYQTSKIYTINNMFSYSHFIKVHVYL